VLYGAFPPVAPGIDHVEVQVTGPSGHVFFDDGLSISSWPQPEGIAQNHRCFNAVHMSVIPKGPYRGHVLVWNIDQVSAIVHPPNAPSGIAPIPQPIGAQSYQAYAIIDPADAPESGIRYRNFLVPIGTPVSPTTVPLQKGKNLFCAGHAWSPHGDLVVAGGTDFLLPSGFGGGTLNYVFNPREICYWPGTQQPYYPSFGSGSADDYRGMWVKAPDLQIPRWYPTVTMTHGLVREPLGTAPGSAADRERAVILGGSEATPPQPGDYANRTYEALVVLAEALPAQSNLIVDRTNGMSMPIPNVDPQLVWNGPVLSGVNTDWLYEYPRVFLLSTGFLFTCGYTPRSAWLDHDASAGMWTVANHQPGLPGTYSSNWQDIRHDGSAVLFPNLGCNADVVLRLAGATSESGPTTDTLESIAAGSVSSTWSAAGSLPSEGTTPDGGRLFANTVILPTGGLLILGGQWQDGSGAKQPLYHPMLFECGQWEKMTANPVVSRRNYHSTAVLLPDGRVFLGGGNDRDWDYEIFSPPYLNEPVVRPVNLRWQVPVPLDHPDLLAPEVHYEERLEIRCDPLPLGHAVAKVVLMAPCSVTHHSDMHQRYVELETVVQNGNRVSFYLPADEREAPRGLYMLWLVTNTGTPSVAEWVVLR